MPTLLTGRTAEADARSALLDRVDARLRWLSAWMIHNANVLRESRDGLKVGGHQASCASMTAIMAVLYCEALRPQDRVAVKPHAGPVLHALHYLAGTQTREQLEAFRAFGGTQSYPSRTKDSIPVDFSTGSVGLGVAATAFASLAQDYLIAHGRVAEGDAGRMIALLGDAELDEGNIYECLIEAYKHQLRNCWWIVDYNRQSLDATTADRMFNRFDDIFRTCGWRVVTLKYGRLQQAAFARPGGAALARWIDECPNAEFAALTYQGGGAWRERLARDLPGENAALALIADHDDDALARLMTNLGGHCIETLRAAFRDADDSVPTLFIAYTVKGHGLPFAGHKDNHAGLMTEAQIAALRDRMGIAAGQEWDGYAGLDPAEASAIRALLEATPLARPQQIAAEPPLAVPAIAAPVGHQSTQAAFGRILLDIGKAGGPLADRIVTTSPDVTVSTNLGAWVNRRGLFRRHALADVFRAANIPSAQKWSGAPAGQHIELGIAESNLFLLLGALGLSADMFGSRLLPIGTVYDPFVARGLDQLNYACYQDARFIVVGTPSGVTLGPEGGAHQSIGTPLIGMSQPGLTAFEPAFADELAAMLRWGFAHVQAKDGGSLYLRLSTRGVAQPARHGMGWEADALRGGYWLHPPRGTSAIAYMGAIAPEALEAWAALQQTPQGAGTGLLAITSPDLLHREWSDAMARRRRGETVAETQVERLLQPLGRDGSLVTVLDGAPAALSWLGGVLGQRVHPLGTDGFGQCGDLPDLDREYGLDADAIRRAALLA